ncbi:MAG: hypothetical protein COU06_00480 [Candidatus Harrisonbacteria bacterium CG10_big_fil_rev_8_21_14_0_10_38_8]|uniref:Glycosyltransferase 2-like domain-containing protein n=1 Tax=Candidatus Harrisonbacteria bacterium CG10_big_fil_rev_8_21_14_0_10_38_8 TaxID=1974582 RepID=A0A2M6WKN4_9BACT|nr:MAG: hypothetical protein COU06_00480 [Candidatus Harrisonbacteria bacterium CG10_big_fil_rev_8_21_14_0_10_38_8]
MKKPLVTFIVPREDEHLFELILDLNYFLSNQDISYEIIVTANQEETDQVKTLTSLTTGIKNLKVLPLLTNSSVNRQVEAVISLLQEGWFTVVHNDNAVPLIEYGKLFRKISPEVNKIISTKLYKINSTQKFTHSELVLENTSNSGQNTLKVPVFTRG